MSHSHLQLPLLSRQSMLIHWGATSAQAMADGYWLGLSRLIVRSIVESGEVLVRFRERRVEDGLAVPLQLQLLEPDHLDSSKTEELSNGGYILQGIEFDALGRRRAYWLFPSHPGENRGRALVSRPVPARQVLHLFERLARSGSRAAVAVSRPRY